MPSNAPRKLAPPPRESPFALLRRWWRSRGQHPGLRYWLLFYGLPLFIAFLVLFMANGAVIGWRTAYDVTVGITSPAATVCPVLAWVLSATGWLISPAMAGAAAGAVVGTTIEGRRRKPFAGISSGVGDG